MVSRFGVSIWEWKSGLRSGLRWLTVDLGAGMDNTTRCVTEHCMADTILVTEKRFVMLAFFHIVHLHSVIAFRGEEYGAFIVKVESDYRRWL